MTASLEPGSRPTVDATQARDLLARATAVTPGTALDRRRHALALLASGVVMAGVAAMGVLLDGPLYILGTTGAWVAAVALILWIGRVTDRTSPSTPRGMARAAKVASWTAFAVLVVGREVLEAASGDASPSLEGVLLLGVAVLLPVAAAAHRIWWGGWVPGRRR